MVRDVMTGGRLFLLTGLAVAVLAGVTAFRTDVLLSRGFDKALDDWRPGVYFDSTARAHGDGSVVGDEGYWLTRAEVRSPAPFAKPLMIGDTITISAPDGRQRRLEVVDLKAIGEPITKVGVGQAPARLLLVTCRVVDAPPGDPPAPVRFIIEGVAAEQTTLQVPAKAL
jgi:hypothetical protein